MTSPKIALQVAAVAALKASADLRALIDNPIRLYQDVPDTPTFPYATIGDAQQLPDKAGCIDGSEIFLDIHAWSRANGDQEIGGIAAAISDALDDADLTLTDHRCVLIERGNVIFRRDPDNITRHAILTFRALTEPSD